MAKYFVWSEFTISPRSVELGINNEPFSDVIQDNILELMKVMDVIREAWTYYCKENYYEDPRIFITSGYRSFALNQALNGSSTSAHRIGAACDFEAANGHNEDLFKVANEVLNVHNIPFDQLIDENNYDWIHLGLKNDDDERRKMIMHL